MTFDGTIAVDDDLVLTLIREGDLDAVFALLDGARARLRLRLPWVDRAGTKADCLGFIRVAVGRAEARTGQVFVIRERGVAAGIVGADVISRTDHHTALGYWLGEGFEGRGLVTRSVRAVLTHLFGTEGLHRVEIAAATDNRRSRAVPERLGLQFEGVRRGVEFVAGRFVDHAVYSVLSPEWSGERSR